MDLWYYDENNVMRCNQCGSEVWYLVDGWICSGDQKPSREGCFNEDDDTKEADNDN